MARLIVISNRVAVPDTGSRAGGLEVAIRATLRRHPGVWFGWSGRVASPGKVTTRTISSEQTDYVVTDLVKEDYEEYYNGFANRVLWPILHYRLDLAEYSRRDLTGYMRVNERFASELHRLLRAGDLIWVHDYHLLPLAKALRDLGHKNRIGFFLHTPFPPVEVVTALPQHERLIAALAQYDLVGFQTRVDATNFARYLDEECGLQRLDAMAFRIEDRTVRIGAFPVGVETAAFNRLARRAIRSGFVQHTIASLSGRAMIIGVDRLDYSKGIDLRLQAFERFLAGNSEWRGNVTYLQITPKSRSTIREYADMETLVTGQVGRINGAYGELNWTPIRYINRTYSRTVLAGLYRAARAALVTPWRDGMNLVAKEYVAAQDPDDPGVLILSRFAGAAFECRPALLVNPYDADAVSAAILRALSMPLDERKARQKVLMDVLSRNDISGWPERFLTALTSEQDTDIPLQNGTNCPAGESRSRPVPAPAED